MKDSGQPGEANVTDQAEIVAKLDSALTSIFSDDGKRTVLYYMSENYGLTLKQACVDPGKLENALTGLLGEVGWMVVKRAILEHLWDRKIPRQEVHVVESASLRYAFGFMKGFRAGLLFRVG